MPLSYGYQNACSGSPIKAPIRSLRKDLDVDILKPPFAGDYRAFPQQGRKKAAMQQEASYPNPQELSPPPGFAPGTFACSFVARSKKGDDAD